MLTGSAGQQVGNDTEALDIMHVIGQQWDSGEHRKGGSFAELGDPVVVRGRSGGEVEQRLGGAGSVSIGQRAVERVRQSPCAWC